MPTATRVQPLADLRGALAQVVEARQRGGVLEPEDALEERRRPVADGTAGAVVPAGFGDQAAFEQAGDGRVGGDAADAGDLRPAARAEVGDDRERLESCLREATLDRPLEQAAARLGGLARGAEGVAAGDVLEHDPAPALAVALGEEAERELDPLRVVRGRVGELVDRQRRRGHDEEGLERPGELVDRVRGDQAERTIHSALLSVVWDEKPLSGRTGRPARARSPPPCAAPAAPGTRPPGRRAAASPPRRRSRSGAACAGRRGSARGTARRAGSAAPCARARPRAAARRAAAASPRAAPGPAGRACARAAAPARPGRCGSSGRARRRDARSAMQPPPSSGGTRRAGARAPRPPPRARGRRARPPRPGRARAPSARAAPRSGRGTRRTPPGRARRAPSHSASRSTKAITIAAMSTSAGSSSSFRSSVRSRSKGPSNASRSSSSSRTTMARRTLAAGSDAAARDGHRRLRLDALGCRGGSAGPCGRGRTASR